MLHEIQTPDGTVIQVEAPDGATPDQIVAFAQKNYRPKANPDELLPNTLSVAGFDTGLPLPKTIAAGMISAGEGTQQILRGLRQAKDWALGRSNDALAQRVAEDKSIVAPLGQRYPIATSIGGALPYLAVPTPGSPALLAAAGKAALSGAVPGAVSYGTPAERLIAAAQGAAGGMVGAGIGAGIARMFGPASMAAAKAGNKWNIPTRAAQNSDSKPIQIIDAVAQNLPFASGVIAKAKDTTFGAFNRAVAKTFGEDTSKITPDMLGAAQQRVGGKIGEIAQRSTLALDPQFAREYAAVTQRANSQLVGDNLALANKWFDNVGKAIDPNTGTIQGTVYKALQSDIGKAAKGATGTVRNVLGDLRDTLRSGMDRSIGSADAQAWNTANRQYFNLMQVADAAQQTPGALSPAQLMLSVNRSQRGAKFGGGNDLAELAQWAKTHLPDAIPNSGTAQRGWWQNVITNPLTSLGSLGGTVAGASAAGIGGGNAAAGLLVPYLLARMVAGKPVSDATKKILESTGGLLGVAGANALLPSQ